MPTPKQEEGESTTETPTGNYSDSHTRTRNMTGELIKKSSAEIVPDVEPCNSMAENIMDSLSFCSSLPEEAAAVVLEGCPSYLSDEEKTVRARALPPQSESREEEGEEGEEISENMAIKNEGEAKTAKGETDDNENANPIKQRNVTVNAPTSDNENANPTKQRNVVVSAPTSPKESDAGISRHTYSRDDVLRIQQRWDASTDNDEDSVEDSDEDFQNDYFWGPYSAPVSPTQPKNAILVPYAFTEKEVQALKNQWSDGTHKAMIQSQPQEYERIQQQQQQQHQPGVTRKIVDYTISSARGWWQRRQKRLQREELEREVERQRMVLQDQAAKERKLRNASSSISHSSVHSNKAGAIDTVLSQEDDVSTTSSSSSPKITISEPLTTPSGDGLSVQLDLKDIQQQQQDDGIEDLITSVSIEKEPPSPHPFCPYILSDDAMVQIARLGLPASISLSRWKRLYSLARDGDSFETMIRTVKNEQRTLLVIRSTRGDIFGGFVDSPWEVQHIHEYGHGFYGSAQAFLFEVDTTAPATQVKIYKWTGANRYIQYCDASNKLLAMGGGGTAGEFGLCVEDDFRRGTTGKCETFGNEPLTEEKHFDILDLEIWGFHSLF